MNRSGRSLTVITHKKRIRDNIRDIRPVGVRIIFREYITVQTPGSRRKGKKINIGFLPKMVKTGKK